MLTSRSPSTRAAAIRRIKGNSPLAKVVVKPYLRAVEVKVAQEPDKSQAAKEKAEREAAKEEHRLEHEAQQRHRQAHRRPRPVNPD
jgi:hypothetical protein